MCVCVCKRGRSWHKQRLLWSRWTAWVWVWVCRRGQESVRQPVCELYLSLECTYTRSGTHISVCLYTDVHIKCVCESVLRGDNEDTWLFGLYGVTFCLKKTKKKTLLVSTVLALRSTLEVFGVSFRLCYFGCIMHNSSCCSVVIIIKFHAASVGIQLYIYTVPDTLIFIFI